MSARSFDITKLNKKQSMILVTREETSVCVKMYSTCIISVNDSGVTLNSGGYRTATTKVAINRALAQIPKAKALKLGVFQKKGIWYVSKNDKVMEFRDGMNIKF